MDNEILSYEEFRVIAHDKIESIVQNLLDFENSQEYQDLIEKFGQQYADEILEKTQNQNYATQYEHVMKTSYDDYVRGFFLLD
jgi:hypothetical protein